MFQLSKEGQEFVKNELKRYEHKYSAIISSLYRCQSENSGWVSPECIRHLSQLMTIPEAHIWEVAKFYTMFNHHPVGKLHIQVCTNISCSMNGARELTEKLCKHYGVEEATVSKDQMLSICRVECLGSCDTAPMMQINDGYHENLTFEKAVQIIDELKVRHGN